MTDCDVTIQRHPELDSGSGRSHSRTKRLEAEVNREIDPLEIFALNQVDLPLPVPVFQLLFTRDGGGHFVEHLVSDKRVNGITRRMPCDNRVTMLKKSPDEVRRHTNVKHPMRLARQNIYAWLLHSHKRNGSCRQKAMEGLSIAIKSTCRSYHAKHLPECVAGSGRSQDTLVTRGHQTLKQVQGDDRVPDDGVGR
jgi:hypothetical protein